MERNILQTQDTILQTDWESSSKRPRRLFQIYETSEGAYSRETLIQGGWEDLFHFFFQIMAWDQLFF